MMSTKPIDFLDIDMCEYCYPWTKPSYYEVPEQTHFGCKLIDKKIYAEEPCKVTDYCLCPLRKEGKTND